MDWIKVGTDTTMQQDPDVYREMGTLVIGLSVGGTRTIPRDS